MNRTMVNITLIVMTIVAVVGVFYVVQQNNKKSDNNTNISPVPVQTELTPSKQAHQIYFKIIPSRMNLKVGETLQTPVTVGSENIEKNGAHILLKFDPKILQVIDSDLAKVGIQASVTPNFYDVIGLNASDNVLGTVDIIVNSNKQYIRSVETIATIKFRAIGKGKSDLSFDLTRTKIYFLKIPLVEYVTNFDKKTIDVL